MQVWRGARRKRCLARARAAPALLPKDLENYRPKLQPQSLDDHSCIHLNTTDLFCSRRAQELALSRTKRVRFRRGVIVSEQKRDCRLPTKKLHKKLRDPCWFLMLQPVGGFSEGEEFAVGAVS